MMAVYTSMWIFVYILFNKGPITVQIGFKFTAKTLASWMLQLYTTRHNTRWNYVIWVSKPPELGGWGNPLFQKSTLIKTSLSIYKQISSQKNRKINFYKRTCHARCCIHIQQMVLHIKVSFSCSKKIFEIFYTTYVIQTPRLLGTLTYYYLNCYV